jgi:carboxyl-terminal processing protease
MTKAMLKGLLGAFILAAVAAGPALAAEPKPSQPHVVLVGISDYPDKQINSRPHAEDDAKALYDLFTNKGYLGADADHVRLLLGKEDAQRKSQPATKENIVKALEWLRDEARPDDLVIFAFLGEGASLGERGDRRCYLAVDSTIKGRDKDAVASSTMGEILDQVKSQKFCALIDVNFKGFTTKEPVPEATLGTPPYKEFLGDDGTEDHAPVPGRAVFLATNGLATSLDLEKHGVFTEAVVDGLKGAADKEGYEPDGVVTVPELTEYLDKEIPALTHKFGKTDEQKGQAYFPLGGRANQFSLTHNPAVAAKVKEQLDKLAQLVKDKKISEERGEEGEDLLGQMPKLEAQRELRKAYQKLVAGTVTPEKFEETRDAIVESRKLKRTTALAFAKTVMEACQLIKESYVKEVNQGDLINWAVRGLYKSIGEKVPQDVQDRLAKAKQMKDAELTSLLADVREKLGKREDLDNHKDVDIALQRMMSHLDPYTTYIDPETMSKAEIDIQGQFTGVGIQIRKDTSRDMLQVVTPIRNSPAHRAGILAGDVITKITRAMDGEGKALNPPEVTPTKGLPLNEAVKLILGKKAGTKVTLTVEREGEDKPLDFELTRGRVEVESVMGIKRKSDADWDYYVDPENKIAYVRLTSFAKNTARDLEEAMKGLKKEGLKGLILDLRFNPGGLLGSARDISDLYIDDGLIVTIKPRVGREYPYIGKHEGSYLDFPMVCMVNGGSASGSEIVSACLQDHKRALIVGERSYGKGSVQSISPFEGGELKLTTASFWRPSNKNLNKASTKGGEDEDWGVRPDKGYLVELSRKDREDLFEHQRNSEIIPRPDKPGPKDDFKDVQLEKALDYLRGQIKTAAQTPTKKAG